MFLKKNYKFYVEKIMKIEKRLHDLLHLKRTKLKQLYVWYCTNELYIQLYVCLHSFLRMIYIKGGRHKTKNKTKNYYPAPPQKKRREGEGEGGRGMGGRKPASMPRKGGGLRPPPSGFL
jgi:hypothetical protein